jgi:hypothetical protein
MTGLSDNQQENSRCVHRTDRKKFIATGAQRKSPPTTPPRFGNTFRLKKKSPSGARILMNGERVRHFAYSPSIHATGRKTRSICEAQASRRAFIR